ncbi:MAG: N-acetylmuramoyl-L-alanine amidase [Candidatus Eremiobacterota bacterium]
MNGPASRILLFVWMVALLSAPGWAQEEGRRDVSVTGPGELRVLFPGGSMNLGVLATTLPDEFLMPVRPSEAARLARAFGAELAWEKDALVCRRGGQTFRVALNQARFPDDPSGRALELPPRLIEGVPYMPMSLLEDLLACRLTVAGKTAYLEPLIRSVRVEGEGAQLKLIVESSLPGLQCKTFKLREPDRFVVDIRGAVLDVESNKIEHPDLGLIRLGQFELGPAVSRIVIPTRGGVSVRPVAAAHGLAFSVKVPRSAAAAAAPPASDFPAQKIQSVTLEPMVGGRRLVLSASGPIQYEWRRYRQPDNRLVLDIPRAALVGPRQDLEVDGDYLRSVRVSQFQPEPSAVVRVVMELEKPALTRFTTGETDNELVIEVMDQPAPEYTGNQGFGATRFPRVGGVICLDPGHGGSDPGAINRALGICEADVTLDICVRLADILRKDGWNVVMTRTEDVDVSWAGSSAREELGARVKVAHDYGADVFVSVHCNSSASSGSNGTSVHYFKQSDYLLAQELLPNVLQATGRTNRGNQKNRFYVLAHSRIPAVLVETAFLSNMQEGRLLNTPEYRQQIAEGIAVGLRQYAARYLHRATALNK